MFRKKRIHYGSILFAVAFLVFLSWQWPRENSAGTSNTDEISKSSPFSEQYKIDRSALLRELETLRSEVRQLRADRSIISSKAALSPETDGHGTSASASSSAVHNDDYAGDRQYSGQLDGRYSPMELEQLKQDSEARAAQVLMTMDNQIAEEPYDAQWAPGMQDSIMTALRQEIFNGTELVDLSCKSSLCRINVQHASVDTEHDFMSQFVASAGFTDTEVFYSREEHEDGSVQETYYISRDGHQLTALHLP